MSLLFIEMMLPGASPVIVALDKIAYIHTSPVMERESVIVFVGGDHVIVAMPFDQLAYRLREIARQLQEREEKGHG